MNMRVAEGGDPYETRKRMNDLPERKRNRRRDYDYSRNGSYFITVCTKDKKMILGAVVGESRLLPEYRYLGIPQVRLSEYGEIVKRHIENIHEANSSVFVPYYVIMPNHIHMILTVKPSEINGTPKAASPTNPATVGDAAFGIPQASPTKMLIPKIVNALKGLTAKKSKIALWQRSYHDHIIRDGEDHNRIMDYIIHNPARWTEDCFYATAV